MIATKGQLAQIPKAAFENLMQLIDEEQGTYRIRTGDRVRYLTVTTDVFDEDTMCIPSLFFPALPPLPNTDWTHATITRGPDGEIMTTFENTPRASARQLCHGRLVDILSVPRTARYGGKPNTYEVSLDGQPAVAKIAQFSWQLPHIENEIAAYSLLSREVSSCAKEPPVAPRVLGHLTENGSVIGILVEKIPGTFANIDNLDACKHALRRVHACGILHGDVNRYNFLIDRDTGHVRLIDFEHSVLLESDEHTSAEEYAELEISTLPEELMEETGRGGPSRLVDLSTVAS